MGPAGFEKKCRGSSRSRLGCECAATEENQAERSCPEEAELYDDVCVVYEDPIAYCPELGAELMDDAYCVKTVREPVRLRTTITLECVGEQCFEKVRADFARKNLLPGDDVQRLSTGADPIVELEATFEATFEESEPLHEIEVVTEKQKKRRGRRCSECASRLEVIDDI